MSKVSVILPVFNRGKYISQCIDSILSNDYPFFELIIIDDGSEDCSGQICDEYASKYNHVFVYHQENKGVSAARNLGITKSSGDWFCFVDSDDKVTTHYISDMMRIRNDADMVFSNCALIKDRVWPINTYDYKESMVYIINNGFLQGGCCSKLFNRTLLNKNHIEFEEGLNIGEDTLFVLKYLKCATRITFAPSMCNYLIGRVESSLVLSYHSFEEESRLFFLIKHELTEALLLVFDKKTSLELAWNSRVFYYLERCIYAAIREKGKSVRKKIYNYPSELWREIRLYCKPKTKFELLSMFFLGHKMFICYEWMERLRQFKRTGHFSLWLKF